MKFVKRFFILFLVAVMATSFPLNTMAQTNDVNALMMQAEKVAALEDPSMDNEEVIKLQSMLEGYGVDPENYWTPEEGREQLLRGYGQWHDLGKGWKVRVDRPHASSDMKPHVHVNNGSKEVVAENVDGTDSHGTNMNKGKVPKDVQKKLRD
jgi:hypothetical protein